MKRRLFFISHPDVAIDKDVPVPDWPLNARGRSRMDSYCTSGALDGVTSVYASMERKARDGAEMIAAHLGLRFEVYEDLGENDRSATGFLPGPEFEQVADAFFAEPEISVRGWERAVDAQARIVAAVRRIVAADNGSGDIAIVAHGGVGALFLCDRMNVVITRDLDQPGRGGGNVICCTLPDLDLEHGWRDISPGHE